MAVMTVACSLSNKAVPSEGCRTGNVRRGDNQWRRCRGAITVQLRWPAISRRELPVVRGKKVLPKRCGAGEIQYCSDAGQK